MLERAERLQKRDKFMSITIEGKAATAELESILRAASEHPQQYGLLPDEDDGTRMNFTWDAVARVIDHDGVADGVIDSRDRDAFVRSGRLNLQAFCRIVGQMDGRLSAGGVVTLSESVAAEMRCALLGDQIDFMTHSGNIFTFGFDPGEIGGVRPIGIPYSLYRDSLEKYFSLGCTASQ